MSSPRKLTAEDIVDWFTPSQAADLLNDSYGGDKEYAAKRTLLGRLRGGMVQAVSSHSVIGGRSSRRETFFTIPSEDWRQADEGHLLWISGDFDFQSIDEESAFRSLVTTRHFGVKFDSQGIGNIIGVGSDPRPPPPDPPTPALAEPQAPETKGPVPAAYLQAWFEFYKKIGGEMKEDPAHAHARMCLPDHSITRQKIRDLLPERPMGRPKKGTT